MIHALHFAQQTVQLGWSLIRRNAGRGRLDQFGRSGPVGLGVWSKSFDGGLTFVVALDMLVPVSKEAAGIGELSNFYWAKAFIPMNDPSCGSYAPLLSPQYLQYKTATGIRRWSACRGHLRPPGTPSNPWIVDDCPSPAPSPIPLPAARSCCRRSPSKNGNWDIPFHSLSVLVGSGLFERVRSDSLMTP